MGGSTNTGGAGYEIIMQSPLDQLVSFLDLFGDKYKVHNLCSERLYDASLFEGKVASFPFDDLNCPPIHLITLFCRSAYAWLKEDIENVVVVHCKAGMARTGLMISSLLLYLKFFPTTEESIDHYNQKRCFDGKGLVLPSQIRYIKYFECILTYFNGENPPGRRCMLRGFRLHRCPYWIRPSMTVSNHNGVLFSTKDHPRTKGLLPEDYWFSAPKKGVMVFALPGKLGLTELVGEFKIHFHNHQGDFYCWLNTTMMENRKVFTNNDLDGFDKRKLPSPGFQVEVVITTAMVLRRPTLNLLLRNQMKAQVPNHPQMTGVELLLHKNVQAPEINKRMMCSQIDDVFSDSEAEESGSAKSRRAEAPAVGPVASTTASSESNTKPDQISSLTNATEQPKTCVSGGNAPGLEASSTKSDVFSFGDDEDYGSE
ncbi:dual-specificity protein phosphatase PTEN [Pyrus ussuriensis x Pyrus communis]|uniref:Dual-specificity protein phosphatase PTEN n=1 Tax=Pyrus ussuriensis x Pyrus communis TaxID=2448454 RepID=A0A5N5FX48_9ROSA|nr:dual-specificity protein phosphatase PTEN [Pyrus ussuriensis x Pyrus communis]